MTEHPVDVAAHAVVHDFPGGAVKLAPKVGMNPGALCNKVNPNLRDSQSGRRTHYLTVDESLAIQSAAGDCRIHEAEGLVLGRLSIPIPDFLAISDMELLNKYAEWQTFVGKTQESIFLALEDGRFERQEFEDIRRRGFEHMGKFLELLNRLEGLIYD